MAKIFEGGGSRTLYAALSLLVALAIFGPASGHELDEFCPAKLEGKFATGTFDFQFQSWSGSRQQGTYFICHCIRNETAHPLWTDWEKTGLSGIVRNGVPILARQSYSTDDFTRVQAKFWYGPQPKDLDTQIVVPRNVSAASLLTTEAQLTVPTDFVLAKTFARSIEALLKFPNLGSSEGLQTIHVKFESQIGTGTVWQNLTISAESDVSWFSDNDVRSRSYIWVGIDDPTLQKQLFARSGPIPLRAFEPPVGYDPLPAVFRGDSRTAAVSFTARVRDKEVSRKQARLVIYGPDAKLILASMPLAYLE
jgi:hypothetical protein